MFSLHKKVVSGYPNADFSGFECYDMARLADFLTRKVYSPIVWAGGSRADNKFRCAVWCALDFDDTLTKAEAREALRGYRYLLAPSRNDGKVKTTLNGKTKEARERFRVLLQFESVIWDKDIFSWNMKRFIRKFNADPLPHDAARVWQPSTRIEFAELHGQLLDVSTVIPVEETTEHIKQNIREFVADRRDSGSWPGFVTEFLKGNVHPNERNITLYKTACFLFECGWTVEKVRNRIDRIPAMADHDKIESTIKSAAKATGAAYF